MQNELPASNCLDSERAASCLPDYAEFIGTRSRHAIQLFRTRSYGRSHSLIHVARALECGTPLFCALTVILAVSLPGTLNLPPAVQLRCVCIVFCMRAVNFYVLLLGRVDGNPPSGH